MKKKLFVSFILAFLFLPYSSYADITSRHLILPEKTWELGLAYFEDNERDYVFAIPFRYAFTNRLEFIPFGLKYLAYQGKENELFLLGHISSLGYGTLEGWSVESTYGLIWRNKHCTDTRIDVAPILITKKTDLRKKRGAELPLAVTHTFTPELDLGIGTAYRYDEENINYRRLYFQNENGEGTIQTVKSGIFLYYFFSDAINIKSGLYHISEHRSFEDTADTSYKTTNTYDSFSVRVDWRF